ncbi:unnamed protein product, partial [Discosporangium mesarthrocarpum]
MFSLDAQLNNQTGSEEVMSTLVLPSMCSTVLPALEPVLSQRGGPAGNVFGFRAVLELIFLLRGLLPALSLSSLERHYIGWRTSRRPSPTTASSATAAAAAGDVHDHGQGSIRGRDKANKEVVETAQGGRQGNAMGAHGQRHGHGTAAAAAPVEEAVAEVLVATGKGGGGAAEHQWTLGDLPVVTQLLLTMPLPEPV